MNLSSLVKKGDRFDTTFSAVDQLRFEGIRKTGDGYVTLTLVMLPGTRFRIEASSDLAH